jgi:hypothetical protein
MAGDEKTRNNRMCEASFYMGEYEALHGQSDHARELIRPAADTCAADFIEHNLAKAELSQLGSTADQQQKAAAPPQTLPPAPVASASNPPDAMAKFLATPAHAGAAHAAAIAIFKDLEDCNDVTAALISGTNYPPELGVPQFDAAGNLSSGLIKESFAASGCGKQRVENVLTYAKDGKITVVAGMPGTTLASPGLAHDSWLIVQGSCRGQNRQLQKGAVYRHILRGF